MTQAFPGGNIQPLMWDDFYKVARCGAFHISYMGMPIELSDSQYAIQVDVQYPANGTNAMPQKWIITPALFVKTLDLHLQDFVQAVRNDFSNNGESGQMVVNFRRAFYNFRPQDCP
ncbi:MAG: hypothetical protein OHK0029_35970 [Armatimonadaceae bacterium]